MSFMKKHIPLCISLILFWLCWTSGHSTLAQDWAQPLIRNLHRVDLRDLGYPMVNEIPVNSKAITSLLTARDGRIYGGTSGETAYLFVFDPAINKVRHLGRIKGHGAIHHALAEDKDGFIYIGTGKNMFAEITLSKGGIGTEFVDTTLWNDIKNHFKAYEGGHLYRYNPKENNNKVKLVDMDCELVDLGIPLASNMIYALTVNPAGDEIYGITYPDGHFFIYRVAPKTFRDLGEIDRQVVHHGPERYWRSLPRALVCDDSGRVYMSGTGGMLQYYCPKAGKIVSSGQKIPGDYYYVQFFKDYAVVDYFAKAETGMIYGGSSDGYLFSFNPAQMRLINLGKLRVDRRLRCLTIGKDGKIYMMAGEMASSRPCQFYCYDPKAGGFEDLGLLIVDRSPYYYWRGYQFDAMATGLDGTIFLGESERLGHLYLYVP